MQNQRKIKRHKGKSKEIKEYQRKSEKIKCSPDQLPTTRTPPPPWNRRKLAQNQWFRTNGATFSARLYFLEMRHRPRLGALPARPPPWISRKHVQNLWFRANERGVLSKLQVSSLHIKYDLGFRGGRDVSDASDYVAFIYLRTAVVPQS